MASGYKSSKRKVSRKAYPKLSTRPWNRLNQQEKALRVRSLEVLRLMRKKHSFSASCKLVGADTETTKRYLVGSAIYKKKRRWHGKRADKIQRGMFTYEKGIVKVVIIHDSEAASVLGKYLNNTKLMLSSRLGYDEFKKMYEHMMIRDAFGRWHSLEVELSPLQEIDLKKESIPFDDAYAY